jgi:hypothetical protein
MRDGPGFWFLCAVLSFSGQMTSMLFPRLTTLLTIGCHNGTRSCLSFARKLSADPC